LEPLSDTGSTGSQIPRNGRHRFALCRQENHAGTPVKSGFGALSPSNRLKIVPFLLRKVQFHANSIGKEL
jgi:hypothetical protein